MSCKFKKYDRVKFKRKKHICKNCKYIINNDIVVCEQDMELVDEELSIDIGIYTFIIINYNKNGNGNRGNLCIKSVNNDTKAFIYIQLYASLSELGFWRLCLYSNDDKIYKGNSDYVQQTFIHLKLQEYIEINWEKIKLLSLNDENCGCVYGSDEHNIKEYIDSEKRNISINIFNSYIENKEDFNHIDEIKWEKYKERKDFNNYLNNCGESYNIEKINKFSEQLEKYFSYNKPVYIYSINKRIQLDTNNNAHIQGNIYKTKLTSKESTIILY
jgi:hypothetical protein